MKLLILWGFSNTLLISLIVIGFSSIHPAMP